MTSQYCRPFLLVRDGAEEIAHGLARVGYERDAEETFSESYLRDLLFTHPDLLPVEEIEPVFGPLIPVCREVPTPAGPIDLLYVSANGLSTLVECKLWRNPEARRKVVGQILDYAKEIQAWSYEELERAVRSSRHFSASVLELARAAVPDFREHVFMDQLARNLRRGRFLLLIVGDGIRENVEQITEFLQAHAHLNFSFALVEVAVFSLPEALGGGRLVQPRVVCRTVEIERAVFRIEGDGVRASSPVIREIDRKNGPAKRTRISEQVFYEQLEAPAEAVTALRDFIGKAEQLGLVTDFGDNSLILKTEDGRFNFATFRTDGTFRNYAIAARTRRLGCPEVGDRYLEQLAELIPGASVERKRQDDPFRWTVRKQGADVPLVELLGMGDKWIALLQRTVAELENCGS